MIIIEFVSYLFAVFFEVISWLIEYWRFTLLMTLLIGLILWLEDDRPKTRVVTRELTPEEYHEVTARKHARVAYLDAEIALRLKQAELDDATKFIKERK
jgi:hypothetical protein